MHSRKCFHSCLYIWINSSVQGSRLLLNLRNLSNTQRTTDVEMSTNIQFVGGKGKQPASQGTGLTGTTYTNTDMDDRDFTGTLRRGELENVDEKKAPEASTSDVS